MTQWWDRQIQRADDLAAQANGSKELLAFYAYLLRAQKDIYDHLRGRKGWLPSGELESDFPVLSDALPPFLKVVKAHGPEQLASEAHDLSQLSADALAEMLMTYWHDPSDTHFFGKAFLQPYLKWLVETGGTITRETYRGERYCPFCGGNPQVSFLQNKETTAESGNRDLICATCLSSWEFRRVVCASCGEERPAKLGYFHSPAFDHVRVEACDTCKHYIKGIDLTRVGLAAPLVDDIDTAPLDLWAREHGFTKIELNLVGI
ncbi:MAG TPA: formate dehydrogenase accessory protein FdhE [Pyrinomonadaceae bacterium]|jgi:FdhE protein|nr:formate dehydrogenase accessory protein FdhE [Pyrinomonadaceae bacterium]